MTLGSYLHELQLNFGRLGSETTPACIHGLKIKFSAFNWYQKSGGTFEKNGEKKVENLKYVQKVPKMSVFQ